MLKDIDKSPRLFDVIGYGEFVEILFQRDKWLNRINKLFENLNVENINLNFTPDDDLQ